jgi:hypothetical protein
MKSLIIYSSKSGNIKKLAKAVYANFPGKKSLAPIEENEESTEKNISPLGGDNGYNFFRYRDHILWHNENGTSISAEG